MIDRVSVLKTVPLNVAEPGLSRIGGAAAVHPRRKRVVLTGGVLSSNWGEMGDVTVLHGVGAQRSGGDGDVLCAKRGVTRHRRRWYDRHMHTATAVGDAVWVFGGVGGDAFLPTLAVYDEAGGVDTTCDFSYHVDSAARAGHTAVAYAGGVLVYGGWGAPSAATPRPLHPRSGQPRPAIESTLLPSLLHIAPVDHRTSPLDDGLTTPGAGSADGGSPLSYTQSAASSRRRRGVRGNDCYDDDDDDDDGARTHGFQTVIREFWGSAAVTVDNGGPLVDVIVERERGVRADIARAEAKKRRMIISAAQLMASVVSRATARRGSAAYRTECIAEITAREAAARQGIVMASIRERFAVVAEGYAAAEARERRRGSLRSPLGAGSPPGSPLTKGSPRAPSPTVGGGLPTNLLSLHPGDDHHVATVERILRDTIVADEHAARATTARWQRLQADAILRMQLSPGAAATGRNAWASPRGSSGDAVLPRRYSAATTFACDLSSDTDGGGGGGRAPAGEDDDVYADDDGYVYDDDDVSSVSGGAGEGTRSRDRDRRAMIESANTRATARLAFQAALQDVVAVEGEFRQREEDHEHTVFAVMRRDFVIAAARTAVQELVRQETSLRRDIAATASVCHSEMGIAFNKLRHVIMTCDAHQHTAAARIDVYSEEAAAWVLIHDHAMPAPRAHHSAILRDPKDGGAAEMIVYGGVGAIYKRIQQPRGSERSHHGRTRGRGASKPNRGGSSGGRSRAERSHGNEGRVENGRLSRSPSRGGRGRRLQSKVDHDPAAGEGGGASSASAWEETLLPMRDMWRLNLATKQWSPVSVANPAAVPPLAGHTAVYCPARDVMITCGGVGAGAGRGTPLASAHVLDFTSLVFRPVQTPGAAAAGLSRVLHTTVVYPASALSSTPQPGAHGGVHSTNASTRGRNGGHPPRGNTTATATTTTTTISRRGMSASLQHTTTQGGAGGIPMSRSPARRDHTSRGHSASPYPSPSYACRPCADAGEVDMMPTPEDSSLEEGSAGAALMHGSSGGCGSQIHPRSKQRRHHSFLMSGGGCNAASPQRGRRRARPWSAGGRAKHATAASTGGAGVGGGTPTSATTAQQRPRRGDVAAASAVAAISPSLVEGSGAECGPALQSSTASSAQRTPADRTAYVDQLRAAGIMKDDDVWTAVLLLGGVRCARDETTYSLGFHHPPLARRVVVQNCVPPEDAAFAIGVRRQVKAGDRLFAAQVRAHHDSVASARQRGLDREARAGPVARAAPPVVASLKSLFRLSQAQTQTQTQRAQPRTMHPEKHVPSPAATPGESALTALDTLPTRSGIRGAVRRGQSSAASSPTSAEPEAAVAAADAAAAVDELVEVHWGGLSDTQLHIPAPWEAVRGELLSIMRGSPMPIPVAGQYPAEEHDSAHAGMTASAPRGPPTSVGSPITPRGESAGGGDVEAGADFETSTAAARTVSITLTPPPDDAGTTGESATLAAGEDVDVELMDEPSADGPVVALRLCDDDDNNNNNNNSDDAAPAAWSCRLCGFSNPGDTTVCGACAGIGRSPRDRNGSSTAAADHTATAGETREETAALALLRTHWEEESRRCAADAAIAATAAGTADEWQQRRRPQRTRTLSPDDARVTWEGPRGGSTTQPQVVSRKALRRTFKKHAHRLPRGAVKEKIRALMKSWDLEEEGEYNGGARPATPSGGDDDEWAAGDGDLISWSALRAELADVIIKSTCARMYQRGIRGQKECLDRMKLMYLPDRKRAVSRNADGSWRTEEDIRKSVVERLAYIPPATRAHRVQRRRDLISEMHPKPPRVMPMDVKQFVERFYYLPLAAQAKFTRLLEASYHAYRGGGKVLSLLDLRSMSRPPKRMLRADDVVVMYSTCSYPVVPCGGTRPPLATAFPSRDAQQQEMRRLAKGGTQAAGTRAMKALKQLCAAIMKRMRIAAPLLPVAEMNRRELDFSDCDAVRSALLAVHDAPEQRDELAPTREFRWHKRQWTDTPTYRDIQTIFTRVRDALGGATTMRPDMLPAPVPNEYLSFQAPQVPQLLKAKRQTLPAAARTVRGSLAALDSWHEQQRSRGGGQGGGDAEGEGGHPAADAQAPLIPSVCDAWSYDQGATPSEPALPSSPPFTCEGTPAMEHIVVRRDSSAGCDSNSGGAFTIPPPAASLAQALRRRPSAAGPRACMRKRSSVMALGRGGFAMPEAPTRMDGTPTTVSTPGDSPFN